MLRVFLECSRTLLFHVQSLQSESYGVIHVFQNMDFSPCNRVTKISVNSEDGDFLVSLPWSICSAHRRRPEKHWAHVRFFTAWMASEMT